MLGVAASWLIQVGVDLYRFIKPMFKSKDEDIDGDKTKQVGPLAPKIVIATIRCTSSLIFASIGAGIGATIVRPSLGQWIGCAVGDLTGPIIVACCLDQVFQVKL
nr:unknown [Lotus japonicus]